MGAQFDYAVCPETNTALVVYEAEGKLGPWNVARRSAGGQSYVHATRDFTWVDSASMPGLPTKEDAKAFCDKYVEHVIGLSITPVLIDTANLSMSFRCPHCKLIHLFGIRSINSWTDTKMVIRRSCPKIPNSPEFRIRLWIKDHKQPSAPTGSIARLPTYNCQECFGTGEFVCFNLTSPCSLCFPKPKSAS